MGVPDRLCAVLESTMAKDPANRPQSMSVFGEALDAVQLTATAHDHQSATAQWRDADSVTDRTTDMTSLGAAATSSTASLPGTPSVGRGTRRWRRAAAAAVLLLVVGLGMAIALRHSDDGPGIVLGSALATPASPGLVAFTVESDEPNEVGVWTVAPNGEGLHQIKALDPGCGSPHARLRWDGSELLVSDERCGLRRISSDGTELGMVDTAARCDAGCDWSPDGSWLAFDRPPQPDEDHVVRLVSMESGREVIVGKGRAAEWSADGLLVIYEPYTNGLWMYDVTDGDQQLVAEDHPLSNPSLSPDGARVAASSPETGAIEDAGLFVLDLEADTVSEVCPGHGGEDPQPDWSPDGMSLVFVDQDGSLAVCDLATSEVRTIAHVGTTARNPTWR